MSTAIPLLPLWAFMACYRENFTLLGESGWSTPAPAAFPPGKKPVTHCAGDWVGPRAGLEGCGKSRPHRIRSPDRPARSEWLYRLSYRGPQGNYKQMIKGRGNDNCIN
jgi:hypothetical protein